MPAEPKPNERWFARLKREGGWGDLILNGFYVLGGLAIVCIIAEWLLGVKSPWGQVFSWASSCLLWLMVLLFAAPSVRRPKFIREFYYGPERQLSDEDKADKARSDLVSKELETLQRPISWAFSVSYFTSLMIAVQWWLIGEYPVTIWLGIALAALVTIGGLSLWGQHRITVYFRDRH